MQNDLYPDANWSELTKKKLLPQALYLYSCRLAWLRYGDDHAQHALRRAAKMANPELRTLATRLLASDSAAEEGQCQGS